MRTSPTLISISTLCLIAIAAVAFSQQPSSSIRGITPEDYYSFEFLTDPHISPNGKLVAYVVTKVDRPQNRRNSSIWMVATDGSHAPWQFTTSPQSTTSPRTVIGVPFDPTNKRDSRSRNTGRGSRTATRANLPAFDEWRRGAAPHQSQEWREQLSMVA